MMFVRWLDRIGLCDEIEDFHFDITHLPAQDISRAEPSIRNYPNPKCQTRDVECSVTVAPLKKATPGRCRSPLPVP